MSKGSTLRTSPFLNKSKHKLVVYRIQYRVGGHTEGRKLYLELVSSSTTRKQTFLLKEIN